MPDERPPSRPERSAAPRPERSARGAREARGARRERVRPVAGAGASRASRPGPPRRPIGDEREERLARRWFHSMRLSGFAVTMLGILVIAVAVLAPGVRTLVEQRQEIAVMEAEVAEQERSIDELGRELARWDDPVYIETQARERLYYVRPGEYSYLVIDEGGAEVTGETPASDEIETAKVDWMSGLLGSLLEAGVTDAAPADLETTENPDTTNENTE